MILGTFILQQTIFVAVFGHHLVSRPSWFKIQKQQWSKWWEIPDTLILIDMENSIPCQINRIAQKHLLATAKRHLWNMWAGKACIEKVSHLCPIKCPFRQFLRTGLNPNSVCTSHVWALTVGTLQEWKLELYHPVLAG